MTTTSTGCATASMRSNSAARTPAASPLTMRPSLNARLSSPAAEATGRDVVATPRTGPTTTTSFAKRAAGATTSIPASSVSNAGTDPDWAAVDRDIDHVDGRVRTDRSRTTFVSSTKPGPAVAADRGLRPAPDGGSAAPWEPGTHGDRPDEETLRQWQTEWDVIRDQAAPMLDRLDEEGRAEREATTRSRPRPRRASWRRPRQPPPSDGGE